MHEYFACLHVCAYVCACTNVGQKRVSDALGLEVQVFVKHCEGAES